MPIPELHVTVLKLMQSLEEAKKKTLIAIPRDHAKTTLAKIVCCWYFVFTPFRFIAYLSNTSLIAKNACRDVCNFLRSDNFTAVFGRVSWEKESEVEGLWIFRLASGKRCILRAAGAGQQLRGFNVDNQRPELAVVDDLEDRENTDTPDKQRKLNGWFLGTFIKALAKNYKIIMIGNVVNPTSLLLQLSRLKSWYSIIYGAIIKTAEGFKSLWADRWPLELLIEDFKEYQILGEGHIWMAEMMNQPVTGANGFRPNQINYQDSLNPDDVEYAFLVIDPAFGKKTVNDCSAVTVHVVANGRPPHIADYFQGRVSESELFDETMRLAFKWRTNIVGIESIAAQSALITLFNLMCAMKNYSGFEFLPLHSGIRKSERIGAWVAMMEQQAYSIDKEDLQITNQLLAYDRTKQENEDDLIDSCAYGPQMIEQYWGLIVAAFHGQLYEHNATRVMRESEVCGA